MYKRTIWQDHVEGIQDGTDMSAANFNNLEAGTMEANALAALNAAYQRYATDVARNNEVFAFETVVERGTLYSTNYVDIPEIATRNTVNYNIDTELQWAEDETPEGFGGFIIENVSKMANGFGVRWTGASNKVGVRFLISGGMI